MDLDRETRRVAMDVRSGWDPRLHGGFGYGSAPEAREATRTIPNVPLAPEAIPALPAGGYGGFPGATDGFTPFVRALPMLAVRQEVMFLIGLACWQHNLAPRTRRERRSMTNKEALEKMRLKEVRGIQRLTASPGLTGGCALSGVEGTTSTSTQAASCPQWTSRRQRCTCPSKNGSSLTSQVRPLYLLCHHDLQAAASAR